MDLPSPEFRRRLRRALLAWFDRSRRDLPWRHDRDPYRIWVSEIMLQQTQVAAVIPYFERFLKALPTLADLAAADEQDVLRAWEGLGYYRRARNLHRAARQIVATHGGQFPDDAAAAQALPGIGRYTAGAILSQAFDQRLPVLETNSVRVLSRLFGVRADPSGGAARRWLWQAAEALLPARQVGDFNQALMELGALVCTPARPRCDACPVAADCRARQLRLQEEIPARPAAAEPVDVREAAVVVRRGPRVLLVQRPDAGRWSRMWEFPHAPLEGKETHEKAARRLAAALTGIRVELGPELLTLRHGVTHHRITMICFEGRYVAGKFASAFYRRGLWLFPRQLADYPVSAPQRLLARVVVSPDRQRRLF